MGEKILGLLLGLVTGWISAAGYAGIAGLLALNSCGIPIPSELILPFSGYLVYTGRFNLLLVAVAGAVGCNVGSAVAYWIGARGGRPLVARYGKWVLMSPHDVDRMTGFFTRFGGVTILVGRMLPIVQTFVAFPAGIARMSRVRFHLYTTLGSLVWYTVLGWIGMKLGQAWQTDPRLQEWFHRFHLVVEIALVLGVVWFVFKHLKRSREEHK
jgi:membrane protein DedA with SNARE-associated domain